MQRCLFFKPILNKLGFDKLELVVSGGAALPTETMALWQIYGVNVVEMYGQTEEAGGIIAGQRGPFPRPGNVGTPADGLDVKLCAADGEILVRGPDLFEGYWRNAETTREVLGADGWLRTGDIAEWRDGNLRLVDRARDFLVTAGGKTISPSIYRRRLAVESLHRRSCGLRPRPQISHRDYRDRIRYGSRLGSRQRCRIYRFYQLDLPSRIEGLIKGEIEKVNDELARVEQIKLFRILP